MSKIQTANAEPKTPPLITSQTDDTVVNAFISGKVLPDDGKMYKQQ
ncbi:hypothetical protein VCRA2121O157_130151 [Vibrio crassostreae]|nr:hypothetical protein VCRA2113O138_120002 [Vibrio crassostreae]CAK1741516.1 hypothetical protein VCRA2113O140_130002 [Vibrio crassostreae]CAK1779314.1 hypothetical protein VCRA2113O137_150002 [Vibrio crassostreae]CAK2250252.1 hypothetical protein VCRA2116O141_130002 [Vibrio crassostreae]CAK2598917.1 hypothetical protein VCRA2113O23_120014 [Vibrio crassostreae]